MKKLEIEVLGSMYQDWDNEEFSWDVDNIIKVKVDNELAINFLIFYLSSNPLRSLL